MDRGKNMNIKQLSYFCTIYELKNMTKAAETLYIAQPALSHQLSALEQELNGKLFIRQKKGMFPTEKGDFLYKHAQTILRHLEATKAMLLNNMPMDELVTGTVSIGLAPSTATIMAIPLIKMVRKILPGVVLNIVSITSNELPVLLRDGRADFILAPDPHHEAGVTINQLFTEELFFLVAKQLLNLKPPITFEEISDIPLILTSVPNKLRSRIDHAFLIEQMNYNLIAESGTTAILVPAVVEGLAGTILPYSAASKEIEQGAIQAYPFEKKMYRKISMCYSDYLPLSEAVTSVMNLSIQLIKTLIHTKTWKYCKLL